MTEPTAQQREAIEYDGGNLLIVACAGSGKTEVISRRIARLVKNGIPKNSLIAFTFTEHAANELKHRIRRHLEEIIPEEPSIGDMYVGTIHSFCLRLLKELSPKYRNWEIMDEIRQAALISTNFTRFESGRGIGLDRLKSRTRTGTRWETMRRFTTTLNVMYQKKININDLSDDHLREAVERYESLAYGAPNYFFDFNRIIDELIRRFHLSQDELIKTRKKFTHLVVDEYQDVDGRQEELISLLSDHGKALTITAVGDDDQALYGFRGASIHNILTFTKRYQAERKDMRENFRCTHAIVEIADQAIRKVHNRLAKEMIAKSRDPNSGEIVERIADPGDIQVRKFPSDQEEALWIANRIKELRGVVFKEKDGNSRPLDYADMAILLRSVKSTGSLFAQKLRSLGIPVVVSGTRGLFNNDEIRLIQATFCLLARADFVISGEDGPKILNTIDTRQFIRNTIDHLISQQKMATASQGRFLAWVGTKLEELDKRSLKKEFRGHLAKRIYPQDIFQEMLRELGCQDQTWSQDILFNLGAFSNLLTQFEAVHQWVTPTNLKGLCLFLSNWAASNADEGGLDEVVRLNSVQIMTVHAAKGLEWPIVFLPRVSTAIFPSSRRKQGPETFLPANIFSPSEYAGGDDGERRLWYVALTRCAKFLNVSSLDRPRKIPTEYFKGIHHEIVRRDGSDPTVRTRATPKPPDDAILLPTTFSDLTYWWRCPFEYQLRSLMGFSPGVGEQYGYGQQLHNILAEIHDKAKNGDILPAHEIEKLVEDRFHLRYTQGDPFNALKEAAKQALVRYVSENKLSLAKTHSVEKPFEFVESQSGALITGVVDLIERSDKVDSNDVYREPVTVVDFKAHRITSPEEFEKLRRQTELQLRLYAIAVKKAFPLDPTSAVAQLITPKPPPPDLVEKGVSDRILVDISYPFREKVLREVRSAVSSIKQSIENQDFKQKGPETNSCPKCDFRVFCSGYLEWRNKDRSSPSPSTPEEERIAEVDKVMEDLNAGT